MSQTQTICSLNDRFRQGDLNVQGKILINSWGGGRPYKNNIIPQLQLHPIVQTFGVSIPAQKHLYL